MIEISETAATQQRNFERVEVTPRDGRKARIPGEGRIPLGTADNIKTTPKPPAIGKKLVTPTSSTPGTGEYLICTIANDLSDRVCLLEAIAAHRHGHANYIVRGKAEIHSLQLEEGPDEQSRSDEKDEGERYFSMTRAMVCPCPGPITSVRRISMSRVLCRMSPASGGLSTRMTMGRHCFNILTICS